MHDLFRFFQVFLILCLFELPPDLQFLVVQAQPCSQVKESCDGHPYEFDGHGSLCEFILGHFDEAKASQKGEVIECPVKTEYGVQDDIN